MTYVELNNFDLKQHENNLKKGLTLNTYRSMSGEMRYNYVRVPFIKRPRILIIEKYRLSTYLGQYGAGRTLKTFSLLPGEQTNISVSTYKKSQTTKTEASSIVDSFSEESAEEFEDSVMAEQSDKTHSDEKFNYHAKASAGASWGWGSASVSGGTSGGTSSSRDEFAKNVSTATTNNASKASTKRDIDINTSSESMSEEGEESSIVREISNINVGRTLNFTFRQMNQEFISFLHLVDIKVAFFNGKRDSKIEVPLSELDDLLKTVIVKSKRDEVKQTLINELKSIKDYKDEVISDFIEEIPYNNTSKKHYLRVKKKYTSTYRDETGNAFEVPGVIINVNKNVLRTDGVIVESLLGQANALDDYSTGLQVEKVRSQELENELKMQKLALEKEKLKILTNKDKEASEIYKNLYDQPLENEDKK